MPEPVKGEDLSNRLDEIDDEELAADSEVRSKLKHLLDEHPSETFTLETLTNKVDVMVCVVCMGIH